MYCRRIDTITCEKDNNSIISHSTFMKLFKVKTINNFHYLLNFSIIFKRSKIKYKKYNQSNLTI